MSTALWAGGSGEPVESPRVRRYRASAVVGGAVLAALAVGAVTILRLTLADATGSGFAVSPFWMFVSVVMAVPLALAFATGPPRRATGLAAGVAIGAVLGVTTGLLVAGSPQWALFVGLATGTIAASAVFAVVTRD